MAAAHLQFSRWPYAILTGLIVGLAGALLPWLNSSPSLWFEQASYDSYYHLLGLGSGSTTNAEVAIVYIDLDSHRALQLDPSQPWPRKLHGQLLERLHSAGAKAVVFDVIFSADRVDMEGDDYLAAAMRLQSKVILGGELGILNHQTGAFAKARTEQPLLPSKHFVDASAGWGLSEVQLDQDFTSRRHFPGVPATPKGIDSMTYAAARLLLDPTRMPGVDQPLWLRYYGPPFSLPNVSFHLALDPLAIPDAFFKDRVVLVGARSWAGSGQGRGDEFRSPFRHWGARDLCVPGVEVHATPLMNLLRGDALRRLPIDLESVALGLMGLLLGVGVTHLRSRPAAALTVTLGIALPVTAAILAQRFSLWIPWLLVLLVQLPCSLIFGSFLTDTLDWIQTRRRLQLERQAAEGQIREQAALIDKARDAIVVLDLNGRLIYANPAAEQLYGGSESRLEERIPHLFNLASEPLSRSRATALTAGEWQGELVQTDGKGRRIIVESRWTLITRGRENAPALLTLNTDVTEKQALQAEALRAQRMETIGALAGGMAHDLNNALSPILMGVQLLRRTETDETAARILSLIEANTHRGADMVKQVLYFARGRAGEQEILDLRSLVHEVERLVHDTFPKTITIRSQVADDLWPIKGHATQIHQLLLNLCVNARDAMPDGGSLSLVADNASLSANEAMNIPGAQPGDFIYLMVSDTGTGIAPEILGRIFEAFFTTKAEGRGTGLGLSSCQRIAKTHGGFLGVRSLPGEGSLFEVYLPRLIQSPTAAVAEPQQSAAPLGQGEWLLVVDDEESVRQILKSSLSDHGYQVRIAAHGAEALGILRRREQPIRLLLCDEDLPDANGSEIVRQARSLQPRLKVIRMSGRPPTGSNEKPSTDAFLAKPFDLQTALIEIHRQLHD